MINRTLTLLLLVVCTAAAQVPSATITGTVVDPSGAVILNAKATAKSTETKVETARETGGDGMFRIAGLTPGDYDVEIGRPGFRTARYSIRLGVRQVVNLDVHLVVQGVFVIEEVRDALSPNPTTFGQGCKFRHANWCPHLRRRAATATNRRKPQVTRPRAGTGSSEEVGAMFDERCATPYSPIVPVNAR